MDTTNGTPPAPPRSLHTYHCICTHLLLASSNPLSTLPTRSSSPDHSLILRLSAESLSEYATLLGTVPEPNAVVIRGEMGFEKRYLTRCGRCGVVVGYWLDGGQFEGDGVGRGRREDVVYLLPGGMMTTGEMVEGKDMGKELELGR